jgi:predicted RNA-binding Zn-ribbon protein involved in translation (DUF1610 family)
MRQDFDAQWTQIAGEVLSGVKEWRLQHPKASLAEIEKVMDERWAVARARLIQDMALASEATKFLEAQEASLCPECGTKLVSRGQHQRKLVTQHNQEVHLQRSYGSCPSCGKGFFPPG